MSSYLALEGTDKTSSASGYKNKAKVSLEIPFPAIYVFLITQ
jgi:hypothetical protein